MCCGEPADPERPLRLAQGPRPGRQGQAEEPSSLGYAKTDAAEKAILKNIYNYGGFRESQQRPVDPDPPARALQGPRKVETDDKLAADEKRQAAGGHRPQARRAVGEVSAATAAAPAPSARGARAAARAGGGRAAGLADYFAWAWALASCWRGPGAAPRSARSISQATAPTWATYAKEFFPPDFREWRIYLHEMVVTVHIAVWGTVLAVVAAVPMGLLSAANVAPAWVLPAGAAADGRLPRDQRDGVRDAVHRRCRPGAVCRRAGAGGAHHRHAGQAVLRSGRGDRPAAGGGHPRHRRAQAGRDASMA